MTTCTATRHDPTETTYTWWGCRCDGARQAATNARRARYYKHGRNPNPTPNPTHTVPILPCANRLRILIAAGYGWEALKQHAGTSCANLRRLTFATHGTRTITRIRASTAAPITAVYNTLVTQPQPYGYAAAKALGVATRNGWGYVDLQAVTNTLNGRPATLTEYERYAVIYTGRHHGHTTNHLAGLVGMSTTRVRKILGEERPPQ